MSLFAVLNLAGIILAMLGFFYLIGWKLGAIEAISVTILVGLSVDFALHISEAYAKSKFRARGARTREAIQRMGPSIFAAALTTIIACLPLLLTTILVLKFFGIVVATSIALSVVYGLYFFCPMLMTMGPNEDSNATGRLDTRLGCLWAVFWGSGLRRGSFLTAVGVGAVVSFLFSNCFGLRSGCCCLIP